MECNNVLAYKNHGIWVYREYKNANVATTTKYVVHANGEANMFNSVEAAKSFIDGLEEDYA